MLELYYNFFIKLCYVKKLKELELDTDSLYPALAEKELEYSVRPELKAEWERQRSKDGTDSNTAVEVTNFFPRS